MAQHKRKYTTIAWEEVRAVLATTVQSSCQSDRRRYDRHAAKYYLDNGRIKIRDGDILVLEEKDEITSIIMQCHEEAHDGRDKVLWKMMKSYYFCNMKKRIQEVVSLIFVLDCLLQLFATLCFVLFCFVWFGLVWFGLVLFGLVLFVLFGLVGFVLFCLFLFFMLCCSFCLKIKCCETCQKEKSGGKIRPPLKVIVATQVFERLQIDLVDMVKATKLGNQYIISLIDHFSKYAFTCAIPSKESHHVLEYLECVMKAHGKPRMLHSDNGGEFKNNGLVNFLSIHHIGKNFNIKNQITTHKQLPNNKYEISHHSLLLFAILVINTIEFVHGAPGHSQSQGGVERFNQTIRSMVKTTAKHTNLDWDLVLARCTGAYNTNVHSTTGLSPASVFYGRDVLPLLPPTQRVDSKEKSEEVSARFEDAEKIRNLVHKNQEQAQKKFVSLCLLLNSWFSACLTSLLRPK